MSDESSWSGDVPIDSDAYRGRRSEDRIEQTLKFLIQVGEIHKYQRTEVRDVYDLMGIDFFVWPEPAMNAILALQVKSSQSGMEEHVQRYGETIACVVVLGTDLESELCEKILSALGLSVTKLRNSIEKAYGRSVEEIIVEVLAPET